MTERDYAIRSFKEVTLNAARHTEERMNLYYGKIKDLMNNYQDLILENQMVLDELEQECQEKINENMAYALQYMDSYDYRMNLGKLKKEGEVRRTEATINTAEGAAHSAERTVGTAFPRTGRGV